MPEFAYIAVDPKGKEKRGTVKATNDADARAGLEARKLYVVKVKPQPAAPAQEVGAGGFKFMPGRAAFRETAHPVHAPARNLK